MPSVEGGYIDGASLPLWGATGYIDVGFASSEVIVLGNKPGVFWRRYIARSMRASGDG
jgi:hypothetical protein